MLKVLLNNPIVDTECKFCGGQCFVPLTTQAPGRVRQAYLARRVNVLATCPDGRAFEKKLMGYNIIDILNEVPDYEFEPDKIVKKGEAVCSLAKKNGESNGYFPGNSGRD